MTDTDWITEGADVVVACFPGGARSVTAWRSTITRATRTQFAVDGVDQRFNRDRQRTASVGGGGFGSTHYRAYRVDDPEGQRLLARYNRNVRIKNAEHAAYVWGREHTRENRLALMKALAELDRYEDL